MDNSGDKQDLSKTEIQRYRMIFNMIDQDGDDKISSDDLKAIAKDVDLNFDDSVIKHMIGDGHDKLDFNSFLKIVDSKFSGFSDENELKDLFAPFIEKDGISSSFLKKNLMDISKTDDEKNSVTEVVDEYTKENKITGYKKFDADKFVESVKR